MYWKVVCRNKETGELTSSGMPPEGICVRYVVGEWVQPVLAGSKLFIFNDEKLATWFAWPRLERSLHIYTCEATGVVRGRLMSPGVTRDRIEAFWAGKGCVKTGTPPGTRYADQVMLVDDVTLELMDKLDLEHIEEDE